MKITPFQSSVMVAEGKISVATMTHGYKAAIIDEIWLALAFENMDLLLNSGN